MKTRIKIILPLLILVSSAVVVNSADSKFPENVSATSRREALLQSKAACEAVMSEKDFTKLKTTVERWNTLRSEPWFASALMTLVEGIRSKRDLELTNAANIFVPSRVKAGKMQSVNGGLPVRQDVFTESGRAAWMLEQLLNIELPEVALSTPDGEIEDIVLESYYQAKEFLLPPDKKVSLSALSDGDKITLAKNLATTDVALAMLSGSKNVDVRKTVAQNANTPVQILTRLAYRDQSVEVRELAKTNMLNARRFPNP